MSKSKFKLAFIFIALAFITASFSSCSMFKQPDYFPLTQGSEWVYNYVNEEITFKTTPEEVIDGVKCVAYEASVKGAPSQREYYSKTDKEVLTIMRTWGNNQIKLKLNPPEPILKFPLKIGKSWEWKGQLGDTEKVTFTFKVTKKEKITVPAGTFNAVKIELTRLTESGKSQTSERWYAPNVGMIKDITKFGPVNVSAELKSYKIGK